MAGRQMSQKDLAEAQKLNGKKIGEYTAEEARIFNEHVVTFIPRMPHSQEVQKEAEYAATRAKRLGYKLLEERKKEKEILERGNRPEAEYQ